MPRKHPNDDPRPAKSQSSGMVHRYKQMKGAGADGKADWSLAEGEAIRHLVATVADQGGAVLLGYSRDQGAYRVIVMDGDEKFTEWIPCTTDVNEALYNLAGTLAG